MFARDIVEEVFKQAIQKSQMAGEPIPQLPPEAVEAAVAQQISDTLDQLSPLLIPPQKPDPLVEIRQQELQNDTAEIQRKAQNDAMDFQIDQAKLEQSAQLAMQRLQMQQGIAYDRNDVNIYRINTQADLKRGQ